MVFPYMDHDLAGLLENPTVKLQPSHIKLYMKQLLEGLEYMHDNNIVHRDIKAANLLISHDGILQIADFGLARAYAKGTKMEKKERYEKYTNCVVTRWYRPPELLMGERYYGGEIDIWGVGWVGYAVLATNAAAYCVLLDAFWPRCLPENRFSLAIPIWTSWRRFGRYAEHPRWTPGPILRTSLASRVSKRSSLARRRYRASWGESRRESSR